MFKPLRYLKLAGCSTTELWQVGIAHASIETLQSQAALENTRITWLPKPESFQIAADPFGIWHATGFTVFVEALDYRVKKGEIHYYRYNADWTLADHGTALTTEHHLSYPMIIEDAGETYMLPEEHRSGKLTLYRCTQFPNRWEPVQTLLDLPAIDASIIQYQNRWWLFYALPGTDGEALRQLHVAYADTLTGSWTSHANNPVRDALDSGRPGGTPFLRDGILYLPTQDCTDTYGGAIHLLRIDALTPEKFIAERETRLGAGNLHATYRAGLHTLAKAGDVTLIDVKRITQCNRRRWINWQRRLRRWLKMDG